MSSRIDDELEQVLAAGAAAYQFTSGGSFILDADPNPRPLWGIDDQVLLSSGEALIIAGGQGTGKTTLAQQLALGRCGFPEYAELLGFPVAPGKRRTLYLAMDRPQQAARSFRRMVGEAWRSELDARLAVWPGPPPYDMARHPAILLRLCEQAGADTVVVDSLKDAAIGLTDDEVGAGYNRARQTAIASGVEVIELHHQRKSVSGKGGETTGIDDLYGSTWLPSGAGSVLLLTGNPGDPVVGVRHLKQPASEVGPLQIVHDHGAGRSQVWHAADLVVLAKQPGGITAQDAASALFDTDKPSPAEREKARRRLERLVSAGSLMVLDHGDKTSSKAARWEAA
ncbi:AAA domain-containing protein [Microlunatus sagamiharensis]|uniref:AAA domain-containing protein n=1 Tax=Microlunatus sagamiharensis TaxID=546874 RepID=A0A1H2N4G4_9ACTN|nr:AAA family ATPase [Microlunatus sagamiharensis]SDV00463.1 AAA domain-containing protein [Microlunatus sagamiharensis]